MGEKHGYGEIKYARTRDLWYKGQWQMNVREGQGTLYTRDKNTFTVKLLPIMITIIRVTSKIIGQMVSVQFYLIMDHIIMEKS